MKFKSQNGIYEIGIPDTYEYEENENTVTIFNNNGVGAISITSYFIPPSYNFVIKDELLDFIQSIDISVALNSNGIADCDTGYCSCEFLDNAGRFWMVWIYFANSYSVFVTYNCDNGDKNIERNDINNIVRSLELNR